jgi:hypothetical protein
MMLEDKTTTGEFWCPLGEKSAPRSASPVLDMTAADWAALSRFSSGDWVSDALIDRLESLGLVEKVFGQALLTRVGRSTIGIGE